MYWYYFVSVAQRVADRDHSKQGIEVKLLKGNKSISDIRKEVLSKEEREVNDLSSTPTVRVMGISPRLSVETIRLYFENTIRSGGGNIVDMIDNMEESNIKYITFENHNGKLKNMHGRERL